MVSEAANMNDKQSQWINHLENYGQHHLIPQAGENMTRLIGQLEELDKSCPGGVLSYLDRAKKLLVNSRDKLNPFEGFSPEAPDGVALEVGTQPFVEMEQLGLEYLSQTCFVLVAGGLGERLGYPNIKISLPTETSTGTMFIQHYIKYVLAYEEFAGRKLNRRVTLPFAIMTSDDTHEKTTELLEKFDFFGLKRTQVTIVKQEKVPALIDNDARMTVFPDDSFKLQTKPHGHGDVHSLLMQSGLPEKWAADGLRWILFFQDTNVLAFDALPALLGVSSEKRLAMNFLTVPRIPGEPVGVVCRLRSADKVNVCNVEYNVLDPLLRSTGTKQGDSADASGTSKFPGNINVLLFNLNDYIPALKLSLGVIPEFVNPKYSDASRTKFKTPTRLECMMQDFSLLLPDSAVAYTKMERWYCFSAVKNSSAQGAAMAKEGISTETAFSGESDYYSCAARMLRMAALSCGAASVSIPEPEPFTCGGVSYKLGPRVVIMPSFAFCYETLKQRLASLKDENLKISAKSTLILEGDVEIRGLDLDGTLIARAKPGEKIVIDNLTVKNMGWEVKALAKEEKEEEHLSVQIRGFKIVKHEERIMSPT